MIARIPFATTYVINIVPNYTWLSKKGKCIMLQYLCWINMK